MKSSDVTAFFLKGFVTNTESAEERRGRHTGRRLRKLLEFAGLRGTVFKPRPSRWAFARRFVDKRSQDRALLPDDRKESKGTRYLDRDKN